MEFTKKELEYLSKKCSDQEIECIVRAVENTDIIIRKVSKEGRGTIISPKRAKFYLGYEKYCDGFVEAFESGHSIQRNIDAKIVFSNLMNY